MLLHVTLASAPGHTLPEACTAAELVVDTSLLPTGTLADEYLADMFGSALFSIEGRPLTELDPGRPPFASGCVILASAQAAGPSGSRQVPGQLFFVVCSGPDAGTVVGLARGTYIVGRSEDAKGRNRLDPAEIRISDPALSRRHCELKISRETISVRDLGSANGTWVDGRPISSSLIDAGTDLWLGYSRCRIALSPVGEGSSGGGDELAEPLKVRLEEGQKSGMLLVGSLLPLVLGVTLALTTGTWIFLAFSSLSAVTGTLAVVGMRRRQQRNRAVVAAAVAHDIHRRTLAAPDPGTLALHALIPAPEASNADVAGTTDSGPQRPDTRGMSTGPAQAKAAQHRRTFPLLRIGLGDQLANVETIPEKPEFTPPMIPNAPVMLDLDQDASVTVNGSEAEVRALARTILLQLGGSISRYPGLRFLCLGHDADLPPGTRFLPGATLMSLPFPSGDSEERLRCVRKRVLSLAEGDAGQETAIVVCLMGDSAALWATVQADLAIHTSSAVRVVGFGTGDAAMVTITLSPGHGSREVGDSSLAFCPDLVGGQPFERIARGIAAGPVARPEPRSRALPEAVPFGNVLDTDPRSVVARWREHALDMSAKAPIGIGLSGVQELDLDAHGPHFLAAGTTGSGKSEFLRSVVTALAACRSPLQINFLLIDFKGGSGLGALRGLPHTVGLLTDLSAEHVARALVSLRSEVRRREKLFAQAGVENLARYNALTSSPDLTLPRLLVVVDEFRMLADAVPTALSELFRIAAIGRSLGVSLFLATQRPQGAVTSDIRANIATSIGLRVQSAAESRDIIGTDAASLVPASFPGRGYFSAAGSLPVPFQTLSTGLKPDPGRRAIEHFTEYLAGTSAPPRAPQAQAETLDSICADIGRAAAAASCPPPRTPVADPLPRRLDSAELRRRLPEVSSARDALVLGLRDEPEEQCLKHLSWSPAADSHLAVLGTARAGAAQGMELITDRLLATQPGRHLYILDGDGQLYWASAAPQVGAYAAPRDPKRASRILRYLAERIYQNTHVRDPSSMASADTVHQPVETTVLITGWGQWVSAFRAGRREGAEDDLFDLVRDGERSGIAVVIAGDRELISAAFFASIPNRLYFPAEASAESLLRWPQIPAMEPVPGRALAMGRIVDGPGSVTQLLQPPDASARVFRHLPEGAARPHQVAALPQFLSSTEFADKLATSLPGGPDKIPVGVSGDELDTAYVRVPPRTVFLVTGQAGSGRTAFLRRLQHGAPPALDCHFPHGVAALEELCSRLTSAERDLGQVLLLIDDADLLGPHLHQPLAALQARGARFVLAALCGPQISTRVPLAAQVRTAPRGALLRPATSAEGEILGVRLALDKRLPPGRCFLVEGASVTEAQAAFEPVQPNDS